MITWSLGEPDEEQRLYIFRGVNGFRERRSEQRVNWYQCRERDSCASRAAVMIYEAMSGPCEEMSRGFKWNQLGCFTHRDRDILLEVQAPDFV